MLFGGLCPFLPLLWVVFALNSSLICPGFLATFASYSVKHGLETGRGLGSEYGLNKPGSHASGLKFAHLGDMIRPFIAIECWVYCP